MRFVVALIALFCIAAGAASAAALSDAPRESLRRPNDAIPSVFDVPADQFGVALQPFETLRLAGERQHAPTVFMRGDMSAMAPSAGSSGVTKQKAALAIISSAILPGLGELILYAESRDPWTLARVPVFFALEGYFWYGYRDNFDTGKDFKRQYEEFGDAHWNLDSFLVYHPCCDNLGGCESWEFYNLECNDQFPWFLFTPKEADREEYYENIGKYDAFVYGWDDWDGQADYWTPRRTYYWSLRGESDKYLLRSDQFIMALILNRVISMADTGWLAYRMSRGGDPDEGWSLRLRSYDTSPCLVISRGF